MFYSWLLQFPWKVKIIGMDKPYNHSSTAHIIVKRYGKPLCIISSCFYLNNLISSSHSINCFMHFLHNISPLNPEQMRVQLLWHQCGVKVRTNFPQESAQLKGCHIINPLKCVCWCIFIISNQLKLIHR